MEACVEAVDAGVVGDDHAVGSALLKLAQEQRLAYLVGAYAEKSQSPQNHVLLIQHFMSILDDQTLGVAADAPTVQVVEPFRAVAVNGADSADGRRAVALQDVGTKKFLISAYTPTFSL